MALSIVRASALFNSCRQQITSKTGAYKIVKNLFRKYVGISTFVCVPLCGTETRQMAQEERSTLRWRKASFSTR